VHHAYLHLYGSRIGDALACVAAEGTAAAVGVLRTVADKHYLSDVLVGLGVGTLSGVGIPLLYYRTGLVPGARTARASPFTATFVPGPTGLSIAGTF
jgi:hypothetical protein